MLDQAIAEAMAGETVYVVAHDANQAHHLWSMVRYRRLEGWHNIDDHGRTIGLGGKTGMARRVTSWPSPYTRCFAIVVPYTLSPAHAQVKVIVPVMVTVPFAEELASIALMFK